jgi:hypothetical protein
MFYDTDLQDKLRAMFPKMEPGEFSANSLYQKLGESYDQLTGPEKRGFGKQLIHSVKVGLFNT